MFIDSEDRNFSLLVMAVIVWPIVGIAVNSVVFTLLVRLMEHRPTALHYPMLQVILYTRLVARFFIFAMDDLGWQLMTAVAMGVVQLQMRYVKLFFAFFAIVPRLDRLTNVNC